jgi:peptidoglycan/LPS O-acetylase OafA/YrhL
MKQRQQTSDAPVGRGEAPRAASGGAMPDRPGWSNPKLQGRIPELDGIRGLAILLVLIFHYVFDLSVRYAKLDWQIKFVQSLRLCWSGVDLFFVLSGFLIGGILLDAKYSASYYRTFYLRRLHRIVPIYFISIAIFIIGIYCAGPSPPAPLADLFNRQIPLWSFPLFLQNIFMTLQHRYGSGWMAVTWSLAVEEQFYLMLPFAVRRLSSRGILGFAIGMILVAPTVRLVLERLGANGLAPYTLLPCRADALGFGLLAAILCRNRSAWMWLAANRRYVYAAFMVLGAGLVVWILRELRLGFTWMAAFYASLLILVVVNPGRMEQRIFRSFPLVRLGTVAYFVYLYHSGILDLCHWLFLGTFPSMRSWPAFWVTLVSLGAVLLLAAISWRLLEKPLILRARSRYRYVSPGVQAPSP